MRNLLDPSSMHYTRSKPDSAASSAEQPIAQEQLRNLYMANPDYAIFTLDPDGYITTWNNGAALMKKYSATEAIGQHFSMLYTEEERKRDGPMEYLRTALAEGSYHEEGIRVRKGGQLFLADVQITPMYKDGVLIGFSKVVSDVTEQGNLRQERDQSRAEVENLEIQKDLREKFVIALTHDLRNPLSSIKSAIELQAKHPDDQKMHKYLNSIMLRGVDRIEKMITDLLDANRIVAREKLPIRGEEFDLLELVNETVSELSASHGNRFQIVAAGQVKGYWDRQALRRAIENLATNAIKYGAPDQPVTIALLQTPDQVEIIVHNHGNPIPPSQQQSIFDQFRRTKSADEGKAKGWGIGLTLVRGITESHRGKISLESSAEKGTSFVMKLPRDFRFSADQRNMQ